MRASDSGKAILNGVNVRNMLMEFLAASSNGHDTCCVTGGQKVWTFGELTPNENENFTLFFATRVL